MALDIRPATNDDVADVVRVIRTVYDEYCFTWDEADYHADLYDLEEHYGRQGHSFFVALREGRVVGTVALGVFPRLPGDSGEVVVDDKVRIGGCDCSLERLYVEPAARRGGVGRALFQRVIEDARARGCQNMEIWSDKRFEEAHRLYQGMGARVVAERICSDPDESPEWGLILPLNSSSE